MQSSSIFRSFRGAPCVEKHAVACRQFAESKKLSFSKVPFGQNLGFCKLDRNESFLLNVKAVENSSVSESDEISDMILQAVSEERNVQKPIFPEGFEELILGVCDETSVAELKMKVGNFEMYLKRDIGSQKAAKMDTPAENPSVPPATSPSNPRKPSELITTSAAPIKSPPESKSPFKSTSHPKAFKLATLEVLDSSNYVIISSPTVGIFRRGRKNKDDKAPPCCHEGDVIKEGSTICFVDHFGELSPIRTTVAGEIVEYICADGDPIGYGDPIMAVLPSFHEINF